MLPEPRAVVFDLDDTLYPYRRFVLSGFRAVAYRLQRAVGVDPDRVLALLVSSRRRRDRGRELQVCLRELGLPDSWLPDLIETLHGHQPRLRLPSVVRHTLLDLRTDGWKLGVLTNGAPQAQARKVQALGIEAFVDAVVYASAHGSGLGKPEAAAFHAAARAVGTPPASIVFVGNDETCDVAGATAAGMLALRCDVWTGPQGPTAGRDVVCAFPDLLEMCRVRLREASSSHAA